MTTPSTWETKRMSKGVFDAQDATHMPLLELFLSHMFNNRTFKLVLHFCSITADTIDRPP